jgi:predicted phage terminase large subunit-like protein
LVNLQQHVEGLTTEELRAMIPSANAKTEKLDPKTLLAILLYRNRIRDSLFEWSVQALADQGYYPARHHMLMIQRLEALERGDIKRLMIFAPPGSAKSMYCSTIFPAWYLARHPSDAIIASSHTQSLAESFGRRVRNLLDEFSASLGVKLSDDSLAAGQWRTNEDGVYLAAGVRGKITGRRADCSIIDDPVSGIVDASNPTSRDSLWDWYRNDLYTRLKPSARVLIVMTRWHEDDLCGRLEEEMFEKTGDDWEILRLPAIAEETVDRKGRALLDPLGREIGEALWPDWESIDDLAVKRRAVGERTWAALFQQRPRPDSGTLFETSKIVYVPESEIPKETRWASAYDFAATEDVGSRNPDWTVRVKMGRMPNDATVVSNVRRMRGRPDEVDAFMKKNAEEDGKRVRIGIPQDPGAAGKSLVAYQTRLLYGWKVESSPESGDKATRAAGFASQMNGGQVFLVKGLWNKAYVEELAGFPAASKDDQVDASSRAFNMLIDPPRRRTVSQRVPGLFGR